MGEWIHIGGSGAGDEFNYEASIKKPIYILFDAHCGSSCESAIDVFEFNKLVTTVGERTGGYIHFGDVGDLILKNSGITIGIATMYDSYFDGRFIEKIGIRPKIEVPPGKDAADFAWAHFLNRN